MFTKRDYRDKKLRAAISRYDDINVCRDDTWIESFSSYHEIKAYIDTLINEDFIENSQPQIVTVTSNIDFLHSRFKCRKKVYAVQNDAYTLYVKKDRRLFYDYDCYRYLYG